MGYTACGSAQPWRKGELSEGEVSKEQAGIWKWEDLSIRNRGGRKGNRPGPEQGSQPQSLGDAATESEAADRRVRTQNSRPGRKSKAGQLSTWAAQLPWDQSALSASPGPSFQLAAANSWGDGRSFPFLKQTACPSHHPTTHWSCKEGPPGVRHTHNTSLDAQVTESSLSLFPSLPSPSKCPDNGPSWPACFSLLYPAPTFPTPGTAGLFPWGSPQAGDQGRPITHTHTHTHTHTPTTTTAGHSLGEGMTTQ